MTPDRLQEETPAWRQPATWPGDPWWQPFQWRALWVCDLTLPPRNCQHCQHGYYLSHSIPALPGPPQAAQGQHIMEASARLWSAAPEPEAVQGRERCSTGHVCKDPKEVLVCIQGWTHSNHVNYVLQPELFSPQFLPWSPNPGVTVSRDGTLRRQLNRSL